jgi:hypothetical protein
MSERSRSPQRRRSMSPPRYEPIEPPPYDLQHQDERPIHERLTLPHWTYPQIETRIVDRFLDEHMVYYGPVTSQRTYGTKKIKIYGNHGLRNMSNWSVLQVTDPNRLHVVVMIPNDLLILH